MVNQSFGNKSSSLEFIVKHKLPNGKKNTSRIKNKSYPQLLESQDFYQKLFFDNNYWVRIWTQII